MHDMERRRREAAVAMPLRRALCRRMREIAPDKFKPGCDGETVVCGWCDCTVQFQMDELAKLFRTEPASDA